MNPDGSADRQATDLAVSVLRSVLESTVETATKEGGSRLLSLIMSSAIASPVAAILAEAFKTLISRVLKETEAIEVKMNLILAEPLRTAVATLRDVLAVTPLDEAEIAECDRQIAQAFDSLRKAEAYTGTDAVSQRTLIRMYLALAVALKQGGRPFAELYVKRMRLIERELRGVSQAARREAESLRETDFERGQREQWERRQDSYPDQLERRVGSSFSRAQRESQRGKLLADAKQFETDADQLVLFCDFIIAVSQRKIDLRLLLQVGCGGTPVPEVPGS